MDESFKDIENHLFKSKEKKRIRTSTSLTLLPLEDEDGEDIAPPPSRTLNPADQKIPALYAELLILRKRERR
jgi:hypothetical protein